MLTINLTPLWGHSQEYKIQKIATLQERLLSDKKALVHVTTLPGLKVFASLFLTNKSKSLWHTEKFSKNLHKEKASGRMRIKSQNRKVCCFLHCISGTPSHQHASNLPEQGRVLSDRQIDLWIMLSPRWLLESSLGKLFNSSSANQTTRHVQELHTTKSTEEMFLCSLGTTLLQGMRMKETTNFRRPKRLFFCRTNAKVFSKHPQDCFYLSCMHATLRQPWLTNNKCTHLQVALYRNRSMASQRVYTNFKTSFQKLPSSIACCATLNCLYKLVKVKI